ncbi:MAG: ASCH domain-containing protein [Anaerolineae bacterium]|nr:ASCH domain-containing protein [Anaerolineae bacterium]MDW7991184.1 ASCH domain-containing protein [Anaerolineae bacterium]
MKALSFLQPRAEQVVRGEKTVDLRTWGVSYRGPLAVHASARRRDERCRQLGFDPDALAYGALLGVVELVDVEPIDAAAYEALRDRHLSEGPYPGAPLYAWHFADPRRFPQPIPCRGRMGLFDVEVGGEVLTAHPAPDPERPFVLYTIPERDGGYRVALYQWLVRNGKGGVRAPEAMWGVELGGAPLRAVADHLLQALRACGYRATDLARSVRERPFYLDEATGVRLALMLLAVKPLSRPDRMEAVLEGIRAMGDEEAYYWFSKCSAGPDPARAQRALRVLLAGE